MPVQDDIDVFKQTRPGHVDLTGAALLGVGSFGAVGIGSASGLAVSAVLVAGVDRYRARHPERRPVKPSS